MTTKSIQIEIGVVYVPGMAARAGAPGGYSATAYAKCAEVTAVGHGESARHRADVAPRPETAACEAVQQACANLRTIERS